MSASALLWNKHTCSLLIYTDEDGNRKFFATELLGDKTKDEVWKSITSGMKDYTIHTYEGNFKSTDSGLYDFFVRLQTDRGNGGKNVKAFGPFITGQENNFPEIKEFMKFFAAEFQAKKPTYQIFNTSTCNTYTSWIEENVFGKEFRLMFAPRQEFNPDIWDQEDK